MQRKFRLALAAAGSLAALCANSADIVVTPPAGGGLAVTNAAASATRFRVGEDGIVTLPGLGAVPVPSTGLCVEVATGRVGTCAIGTGTVTSIATGTGLTGGPVTTTGTLSIANLGVDTPHLAERSVTAAKLATNGCVDGQVLRFNGTTWVCSTTSQQGGNALGAPVVIGTTDNQPLVFVVNGATGLEITPHITSPSITGGFSGNTVTSGVAAGTIAGGGVPGPNDPITGFLCDPANDCTNRVTDHAGTVGGGVGNQAGDGAGTIFDRPYATVAGGRANIASGVTSAIGGGYRNTAGAARSTIAGGQNNTASGDGATVSGGASNTASGGSTGIGGGFLNTAVGEYSRVGGGRENDATGLSSTIGGGYGNDAAGDGSTVAGGTFNAAGGLNAFVAGGSGNSAGGTYSFAAGRSANAAHSGAFVWADSVNAALNSTISNQFLVRASGGVILYSNAGATTGVSLAANSGSWTTLSDVEAKDDFAEVDVRAMLAKVVALPVRTWRYKGQHASIRHIGPTAQDFRAAFNVGDNERGITTVDADGVALAAIQGLQRVVADQHRTIEGLQAELAAIKRRLGLD